MSLRFWSTQLRQIALVTANAVLGLLLVTTLMSMRDDRAEQVADVREQADNSRLNAEHNQRQVEVREAILDGLRQDDPYVVEMLLRDKLDYQASADEVNPPSATRNQGSMTGAIR